MIEFVHRTSQEVTSSIETTNGPSAVTNTEIVVGWDTKNIKIMDINGQLISEVPELDEYERIEWELTSCCLSRDQMAVFSQAHRQLTEKLSIWDVSDPLKATRLTSQNFNFGLKVLYESSLKMDEHFIVISTFQKSTTKFTIFSKKTLNLHWQMRINGKDKKNFAYSDGLLLAYVKRRKNKSEYSGASL